MEQVTEILIVIGTGQELCSGHVTDDEYGYIWWLGVTLEKSNAPTLPCAVNMELEPASIVLYLWYQ